MGLVGCGETQTLNKELNPTVTIQNDNTLKIEWSPVQNAKNYRIYKSPSRYGTYESLGAVDGNSYISNDTYAYFHVRAEDEKGRELTTSDTISFDIQTFGKNTYVFSQNDPETKINKIFQTKYLELEKGEFTSTRFSALFKPGTYSNVSVNVGYYTTIGGLGALPRDVNLGGVTVDAQDSLINFWRGIENFYVHSDMLWAVSQATSIRKVQINGNLSLSHSGYTSGGFLADSVVTGKVISGSQQQWLSRNVKWNSWEGNNWHMCFAGVDGNLPTYNNWENTRYTIFNTTDPIREKAYLTFDNELGYRVFVPAIHTALKGTTWKTGEIAGEYIPLSNFYVAKSDIDNADTINTALESGKHLILSAGVYNLDKPIIVSNPNTVILGLGLATLKITDDNTDCLMRISDVDGIKMSGILFDAGKSSNSLLIVGEENSNNDHSQNPSSLSDLFFRVGGATNFDTSTNSCVIINSNNVLGDNFWVWRADHSNGVDWTKNVCENGIIVNGDNVRFYGLFVEHFHEYQTLWNGENGTTYFYQSEIPYDVPKQGDWKSHNGTVNGFASYKVGDNVTTHNAYSLGVYANFHNTNVVLENAIETPLSSGINFNHIIAVNIPKKSGSGITHVINGQGNSIYDEFKQAFVDIYKGN